MNKDAPPVQPHSTAVCANLPGAVLAGVSLLTMFACTKREQLSQDELFRRIQVLEAGISEAQLSVRSATSCREAHGPAEEGVCDPSVALCKLTDGVDNKDALQRCLMAGDSCRAARDRARALCATPPAQSTKAAVEAP